MKVLLINRSLAYGGIERQLTVLAAGLRQRGHDVSVVVFYPGGALEADLLRSGVSVVSLDKRGRWDVVPFLFRMLRSARSDRPDVLYSFLPVPNIIVAALLPVLRPSRVVWGVGAADVDLSLYDWLTRLSYGLEARLSRLADLIISKSVAGRDHAVAQGFPAERMVVIPNGIDIERFRPDAEARRRLRGEWGVAEQETLIGLVARLDPIKDHPTFLRAAAALFERSPGARFACVGDGPAGYRRALGEVAAELGIGERVVWVAARDDVSAVYNALDIATCASLSEGFPNTVGEAMACGTPCVVTDVGDSAWVVGDTGVVVPPGKPQALAQGWRAMLERLEREGPSVGAAARARIAENFRAEDLARRTEAAFETLLGAAPGAEADG